MGIDNKNPIIFIPGIMGSMGNEIIPGTGGWSFGAAGLIYNPFIKGLESNGYVLNKNLYICFYDWRKSNIDSAREYLLPLIEKIKAMHKNKKIDIICHSMGGLIARTYIQYYYYKKDIGKLIMIATPNKGSVSAYYFWTNGDLFRSRNRRRGFQHILSRGYIWLLQKIMNFSLGPENLEQLHNMFPSVKELLPSYDYGPCLVYSHNDNIITVPYYYLRYRNDFLDRLNYWSHLLHYGVEEVYCIVGEEYTTGEYLIIHKENFISFTREDIIDMIYTKEGDSTVTSYSAQVDGVSYYLLKSNHHQIVEESLRPISKILNLEEASLEQLSKSKDYGYINIVLYGRANIHIIQKKDKAVLARIISDTVYTKYEHVYERFGKDYRWLILKDIPKEHYYIEIRELDITEVSVLIMTENEENEYSTLNKNKTLEIQVL